MLRERIVGRLLIVLSCVLVLASGAAVYAGPQKAKRPAKAFRIGNCRLQISSVGLGKGLGIRGGVYVPAGMREGETVLSVEAKVLSGNAEKLLGPEGRKKFKVWVTDKKGNKNRSKTVTSTVTAKGDILSIHWMFVVPKTSKSFLLHVTGQRSINLAPYLK